MGVYVYTRRSDMRVVDGFKIVPFAFAYKPPRGYEDLGRTAKRLLALAENAAEKTADAVYGFKGQWNLAKSEKLWVFEVKPGMSAIYDDSPRDYFGYITAESGKLKFVQDFSQHRRYREERAMR